MLTHQTIQEYPPRIILQTAMHHPEDSDVLMEYLVLEKEEKLCVLRFRCMTCERDGRFLILRAWKCETEGDDMTYAELEKAEVTEIFLRRDTDSSRDDQYVTDMILTVFDEATNTPVSRFPIKKSKTYLGAYYGFQNDSSCQENHE